MVQRLAARPGADLSAVQLRVEGTEVVSVEGAMLRLRAAGRDYAWPMFQAEGSIGEATVHTRGAGIFDLSMPFVRSSIPRVYAHNSMPDSPADNPVDLLYATFLGGSGSDWGEDIAVDVAGTAFVTGYTYSSNFPTTPGTFDTSHNGNRDIFVVKLNPAGSGLTYATFLGGSSWDYGWAIAVDGTGSAYVTGDTGSSNFPTTSGAFDRSYNGNTDVFVVKLNSAGSGLIYATFLGGSGGDVGYTIAVDGAGSAYVAGDTYSGDFPTTPGAFDTGFNGGNWDIFLARLNPAGSGLAYATFLGGSSTDGGYAIAVDGAGNTYVTGRTESSDFPTTPGAFDRIHNGGSDAFVAKFSPAGTGLVYATFLGGGWYEYCRSLAVDGMGSVYVTGGTSSSNFPTTPGAFDTSYNDGGNDAFVAKLNSAGSGLVYATFLGGSGWDGGNDIAVDGAGSAYLIGIIGSINFPTSPGAFDTSHNGGYDAFAAKLNRAGSGLVYATFLGGSNDDGSLAIAVDGVGNAYLTGNTGSSDFPTTPGAFDTNYNGDNAAFVVKLAVWDPTTPSQYMPLVFYRAQPVVWEQEPNNTSAAANGPLVSGMNYLGFPNDASDYYFFQTTSRGQITIDLNNHTGQGIQLLLYYPEGNLVGQDITPPYRLEYTGDPGRYYVRIYSTGGFNTTTPYTLRAVFPASANNQVIVNGDFENGLAGWSSGGSYAQPQVRTDVVRSGARSVALGNPDEDCTNSTNPRRGDSWVSQVIDVPNTSAPQLTVWYRIFTWDSNSQLSDNFDRLEIWLNNSRIHRDANRDGNYGCNRPPTDLGWRRFTYDLSAYRGQQVTLKLSNVVWPDEAYNTWTYVDDIAVAP